MTVEAAVQFLVDQYRQITVAAASKFKLQALKTELVMLETPERFVSLAGTW